MLHCDPLQPITDDQVAAYDRDGAILLQSVFDMEWIELLREAVEQDKAQPGPMVRHNTPPGNAANSLSISNYGSGGMERNGSL